MSAEIVPLRDGPTLTDVAGQLRALADRIEAGEYGEVDALIAVMPREQDWPVVMGWGLVEGAFEPLIQLELARQWLLRATVGLPIS